MQAKVKQERILDRRGGFKGWGRPLDGVEGHGYIGGEGYWK